MSTKLSCIVLTAAPRSTGPVWGASLFTAPWASVPLAFLGAASWRIAYARNAEALDWRSVYRDLAGPARGFLRSEPTKSHRQLIERVSID